MAPWILLVIALAVVIGIVAFTIWISPYHDSPEASQAEPESLLRTMLIQHEAYIRGLESQLLDRDLQIAQLKEELRKAYRPTFGFDDED